MLAVMVFSFQWQRVYIYVFYTQVDQNINEQVLFEKPFFFINFIVIIYLCNISLNQANLSPRNNFQHYLYFPQQDQILTLFILLEDLRMGIGDSKELKLPVQQDSQISKIHHERFANRQIIKNQHDDEEIMIKLSLPSQKQYNTWKDELTKMNNKEVLLLPISHKFHKEGFCGSSGYVEIVYQNYPFILSDEIHNRECLNAKFFQENQLWYLAFTLLTAAQEFHGRGRKVGDIRPMNIFISEDGSVKLACLNSWPLQKGNYEKSFQKQITYISPEEVIDLGYGKTESTSDFQLSETFSIGLTLLDAALLTDSTDLYKNSKQINYEQLEKRLSELATRSYSNPLSGLIKNMCEVNPENRTKVRQLFQWLLPYESSINSFTQFQPESLPPKFGNKSSSIQNQQQSSGYSNIYNPKPYTSTYNPTSAYIQSNPPKQSTSAPYYTSGGKTFEIGGSGQPTGTFKIQGAQIPPVQIYTNGQTGLSTGVIQSTYVPFKSNFSLQKIDQQLQQSRKLFPS